MEAPTKGAESLDASTWRSRPWLARAVWLIAALLPPVVSGVGTWLLRDFYWRGDGRVGLVAIVVQVAAVGIGLVLVVERLVRRLIPLSQLLQLTLHFPDQAPSRYSIALRMGTIKRQQQIIDSVTEVGFSADDRQAFDELVALLLALGRHERLTRGHTERVRAYSDLIGAGLGLDDDERQKLRWAAVLHDVGKLGVPAELLALDRKPTDDEWELISQHPAIGEEMVERFADWLGDWRFATRDHHEKWDGSGYPSGLLGNEISLAGRIVALADAYDVITSVRSYKKAMPAAQARAELVRCSGGHFDPTIVRAFLRISAGDLSLAPGRAAWTSALPSALINSGAMTAIPLTAAVAFAALPFSVGLVGLIEEEDPFALFTVEVAATQTAQDQDTRDLDGQGADSQIETTPVSSVDPTPEPTETAPATSSDPQAANDAGSTLSPSPTATAQRSPTVPSAQTPTPTTTRPGPSPTPTEPSATTTPGVPGPTPATKPTVTGPAATPTRTITTPVPTVAGPPVGVPTVAGPTVTVPTVTVPTVVVPVPTVVIPTVIVPTVIIPTVTVPTVVIPTVTVPTVTVPTVTVPTVVIPTVIVPTVTVPTVTVPTVTVPVPTVVIPTVVIPTVIVPTVTVPTVVIPTVIIPTVTVPTVVIPTVTVPTVTVPIPTVSVPGLGAQAPTAGLPTVPVPTVTIPTLF